MNYFVGKNNNEMFNEILPNTYLKAKINEHQIKLFKLDDSKNSIYKFLINR
jgi:hypothetical protein